MKAREEICTEHRHRIACASAHLFNVFVIKFLTSISFGTYHMGLVGRKPVFGGLQTTKAQTSLHISADQPAHPHSLISVFVIC